MTFARTKIQPPRPRASYVERGGLHARLVDALGTRRVVLVCAPGGYGKTMLLAQAVARLPAGHALAWVAADAGDDLPRLVECLLAALEPFDPPWRTAPESLPARVGRSDDEERAVAAEILNALDACEVGHGVIAFDDLHRVDDPAVFRFLDLLVERLPARWTLALSSRTEPPLALARLRASDELAEFRQLQLQFARDDARRMAAEAGIPAELADRLFDRTQGWPAGLRIAIGAARADAAGAVSPAAIERALRAGNRPLFDFLLTEVLGDLDPELAEFLQRVSVLPELDAKRCAAVSGNENAAALLDAIERLGLFVETLDAPVRTLRLHDLLRDALRQRVELERPELHRELRARAADSESDPVRRIGLRLDAEDFDAAAQDAYVHVPPFVATHGTASALKLLDRFPAAFRERSPELAYVRGLIEWIRWDFPAMLEALDRAERGFASAGAGERTLLARAVRAHGLVAGGRLSEAEGVLESLARETLSRETRICMLNARAWLDIDLGRLRAVAATMDEKVDLLERVDRIDLWYHSTPSNRMPWLPGSAKPLMRHAEALLRVAGDAAIPLRSIAYLVQAWCAAERGRFDEAEALCERAREDARWTGSTAAVVGHLLLLQAVLHVVAGDAEAAVAAADERLRALQGGYGPAGRHVLTLMAARIAASAGHVRALRAWLDATAALEARFDAEGRAQRSLTLPLAAQLAWLDGRADEAVAGWRAALGHEEAIDLFGGASEVRVRLAHALAARGEIADAARVLAPVFARVQADGAPGGVWLAAALLDDLAAVPWGGSLAAKSRAQLREWATLAAGFRASRAAVARGSADAARQAGAVDAGLAASLSPREIDVLQRIAAGDSNKLIARAFDLSPHTVKRHVANILDKLGVETRGQAAARYREARAPG